MRKDSIDHKLSDIVTRFLSVGENAFSYKSIEELHKSIIDSNKRRKSVFEKIVSHKLDE